jgi:hypothetical protein
VLLYGAAWSYWKLAEKERAATSARQTAEQTLRLYEAGKDEVEKLSIQNAESVEQAVVEMHLGSESRRPRELLLAALEAEPDNPVYLRAMGEHFFISQRFNDAIKYLDRGEKRAQWPDQLIRDLAHEFAEKKPDDDQLLSKFQMLDLLRRIDGFNGFEAMIILRDQKHRLELDDCAEIVEEHLRSVNPNWKNGFFEFDVDSGRMRIGGKGLERLSESGSVIVGLRPRALDISGSDIRELWREANLVIETLDVRDCPLDGVGFVSRLAYLKELIVLPGQFTEQELSELPDWVGVTERDAPTAN